MSNVVPSVSSFLYGSLLSLSLSSLALKDPPVGLEDQPMIFWTRCLRALGYDNAGLLQPTMRCIHKVLNKLLCCLCWFVLGEVGCTKPWETRFKDVISNYANHGICRKLATCTDEDLEKCDMAYF